MVKRTRRIAGTARATDPTIARSRCAQHEEVSRVIRLTPMLPSLELAQTDPFLVRLDARAAFALVALASSATSCAASWLLGRWLLS